MQALVYLAEVLFLVLFLATLREYVRRRDPVSRDLALVFSPLAVTFVAGAWSAVGGSTLAVLSLLLAVLLLAQPFVLLHLVSLVRTVSRVALWLAVAMAVVSGPALIVTSRVAGSTTGSPVTYAIVAAFVGLEALAAIYLVLDGDPARRPGGDPDVACRVVDGRLRGRVGGVDRGVGDPGVRRRLAGCDRSDWRWSQGSATSWHS